MVGVDKVVIELNNEAPAPTPPRSSVADEWEADLLSRHPPYLPRINSSESTSFFSCARITFGWLTPLIVLGASRPLQKEDLGSLHPDDKVGIHLKAFLEAREECEQECIAEGRNATAVALARFRHNPHTQTSFYFPIICPNT